MGSRRRWPWIVAVAVAGAALLVVGALLLVFVLREDPGPKSVEEAVEEFRTDTSASDIAVGELRPEAGVYLAAGEGRESISFPPVSQEDGAQMPVTVVHEPDGCWTLKIDYNVAHWQSWRYCSSVAEGTIVEKGGETYQRWDFGALEVENLSTFVCDPPVLAFATPPEVGSSWPQACDGTNTQTAGVTRSEGTYELVGVEELLIGGERVLAHHYRQARVISGAQTGEQSEEVWMAADTGLPVRAERSVRIESSSPVGAITYDESGTWQLTSRAPTR